MKLSTRKLLLIPNPFAAPLGADGRAMALCPTDPGEGPAGYVGARTKAATVKRSKDEEARLRSPFGPRDKVSVTYDLKPRAYPDTSFYRTKVVSGEVFEVEAVDSISSALLAVAQTSLAAFVAEGGDRAAALASWRTQGLGAVANVINLPKLPPGGDALKEAPGTGVIKTPIEVNPGEIATLTTEGAVS